MASQSLYRKWRSQTFADLIGQDAVVRTLQNALHSGRLAHAYLFCGPRGTGKTSTARLLAKTVNCEHPQNGEPCNACLPCQEISNGISMDVIEIDAASNRGIDDIRDLREKVAVRPGIGRYKLYIIDEVHMLTTEAFNALLKTLEEPPPHVIFVLATTEVHKVPATVVSRCQRFDFKRIPLRQIVQRLHYIAEQEQLHLDLHAAELIARAASGSLRDALSLLDQAIAYCGTDITLEQVQRMLGVADPRAVYHLVSHIADLDAASGLRRINDLAESGTDLRQLNGQLAEYWRAMMLAKTGVDIAAMLDITVEEREEIITAAASFSLDELIAGARTFALNDLIGRSGSVPQLAIELAFLECLERHRAAPMGSVRQEGERSTQLVGLVSGQSAPPQHQVAAPELRAAVANGQSSTDVRHEPLAAAEASPGAHRSEQQMMAVRDATPTRLHPDIPSPSANTAPSSHPTTAEIAGAALELIKQRWLLIVNACKQKSYKVAALLRAAHPVEVTSSTSGNELVLAVDHEFHLEKLHESANRAAVEWAVSQILERPWRVRFRLTNAPERNPWPDTPADSAIMPLTGDERKPSPTAPSQPPPGAITGRHHLVATAAPLAEEPARGDGWQHGPESGGQIEAEARDDRVVAQIMRDYPAHLRDVRPRS
jgi:DNA polymerase-3 subunit gamma/tau